MFSTLQPLFLPAAITDGAGRELATVTALGAFLAASVFAEEDPSVAEKHFSGKQNSAAGNVLSGGHRLLVKILNQLHVIASDTQLSFLHLASLAVRAAAKQLQTDLEFYRQSLHKLFHGLLVNASSRDSTLRYLAEVTLNMPINEIDLSMN